MKKNKNGFMVLAILFLATLSYAQEQSITDWLDAAKQASMQKVIDLTLKDSHLKEEAALAKFYPKISLVGTVETYNSPTNAQPVPPTESAQITKENGGFPFSKTLEGYGAKVSMPIFVKSLMTQVEIAQQSVETQKIKHHIATAQKEATIIAGDAKLIYLENLDLALQAKLASLQNTRESVLLKVHNGRLAEIELIRIDEQINQIVLKQEETRIAQSQIQKLLTSILEMPIEHSVPMTLKSDDLSKDHDALDVQAQKEELLVAQLSTQAAKESLYPTVSANAFWQRKYGESYNNGENFNRDYSGISLSLTIPLYDKESYVAIEQSRVKQMQASELLKQTENTTNATLNALSNEYGMLQHSQVLAQKSVDNYETLLNASKVSYLNQRMTQEEYLRYEEALVSAKASLYATQMQLWENLATRTALLGKDFKRIVE
jgi:outer membrane protein TolC